VLLRPQNLDDAVGELAQGEPREHAGLPAASYLVTKRPARIGAPLELLVQTPQVTYREIAALKPAYQAANIACAIALCENYLGRSLDVDKLYDSIVTCPTPGRFDVVRPDPVGLIDACHNPQSVETFLTAVRAIAPEANDRPALLCAVLADKDVDGIVELLAHEFPCVYVTQTTSARALPAGELGEKFASAGARVAGTYSTVDEAIAALADTPFIACGSITLAGEVAGLLR